MTIATNTLSEDVLLNVCRLSRRDKDVTPEFMAELQSAASLVGDRWPPREGRMEHAIALLATLLAGHRRYNPTHLPFGYTGPIIQSKGWLDRDDLLAVTKQIAGLRWENAEPYAVSAVVGRAVSEALGLGFLQEKQYDAWQPGMASGSGWRTAVAATAYGSAKARALATAVAAPQAQPLTEPWRQNSAPPAEEQVAVAPSEPQPSAPTVAPASDALPVAPAPTAFVEPVGPALGRLNEMERTCLEAMGEKGIVSVDAGRLPNQQTLAMWAGYPYDTTFKTALSSLVKAGYLDNGRHHGKRGGYFLTASGASAFDLLRASQTCP